MEPFLIRLLITIGVIWLIQLFLGVLKVQESARTTILVIVAIIAILWLFFGASFHI
jgi:hypothetical protein